MMNRTVFVLGLAFVVVLDIGLQAQTPTPTPPSAGKFGLSATSARMPVPTPTPNASASPSARIYEGSSVSGASNSGASTSSGGSPSASGSPASSSTPGALPSFKDVLPGISTKEAFASVFGSKQGQLGGATIRVVKFDFYPAKPTDATGQIQSLRPPNIRTVTITKRLDAASIPLLTALANNEPLTSATLAFIESPPTTTVGQAAGYAPKAIIVLKLVDATVASVHQYFDSAGALEDVTFSFRKIDFQNLTNNGDFSWSNNALN